jgi:hypothetical protein
MKQTPNLKNAGPIVKNAASQSIHGDRINMAFSLPVREFD